ncbi:ketopantoate reductase family protein [Ligaoa zhengdingensis]|uniref:ketopantoate reductase family protein n=1 Tax=Ligaoa zhengdingensis TaxID=2763658 RepID=UPI0031BA0C81
MKILVYGSGVIGSYLAHVLCTAGNDVTMLARGRWKEKLEEQGLNIRHHLQHKTTLDHPRVIGDINEDDTYDAVFAVMPYHRINAILEPLARVRSPLVILVGNNMSPAAMQDSILEKSVCDKQVLFGFQATAGKRDHDKGMLICERAGAGAMDIGGLHSLPEKEVRDKLTGLFARTGYKLRWQPDMESYLICHLAAILPIGFLAYACQGDLTASTGKQRKFMRMASREAYAMLKAQGIPILPENDDRYYEPGVRGSLMQFLYFIMAKNKTIGDLVACEHCRNACEEMEMLNTAFEKIISRSPDFPMPNWRRLKGLMPDWETVRRQYADKVH